WSKSDEVSASAAGESANSEVADASPEKSAAEKAAQEIANTSDRKTTPSSTDSGFRFAAYNVRNWLVMDRYIDRKLHRSTPKPDEEKAAVIRLLAAHKPDVIGLCEIGTPADLDEIREMLHEAGLNLPHTHYTSGSDAVRRLGLLSRFPIVSSAKPEQTEFRLDGRPYSIGRGILDASIEAHGKSYRFLGVHLKSKRPVPEVDQEQIRIHEARLLRRHVDSILADDPDARLVVYGDFNDTRPTSTVKTITGNYNSPNYLTALPAKDSQGDAWTHHWVPHDIYSRIDFVTVSRVLRSELDFQNSYIIDDDGWDTGSDHRAILAIFR
ncbi:MAG: endonuclease/exonuclease/phosphatase family protein, partial [Luteolibacter sp.]